jgi:hypothetical protein
MHGVSLRITAPQTIAELLDRRLASFRSAEAINPELDFTFVRGRIVPNQSGNRRIYDLEDGYVTYDPTRALLAAHYRNLVALSCQIITGRVRYVLAPDREADRMATQILFTLPLIELMRRRSLFNIHASGMCLGTETVLLAGTTGAGKSTLTLALVKGGWDYLGDDMLFLRPDGRTVLGFPEGISYTDETMGFFQGLPEIVEGSRKGNVRPEIAFGCNEALLGQVGAVVFPRIAPTRGTLLTALDPKDAFMELAPNVLMSDQTACEAHLQTLALLTRSVPSFRMNTGWDLTQAADRLRDLIRCSK